MYQTTSPMSNQYFLKELIPSSMVASCVKHISWLPYFQNIWWLALSLNLEYGWYYQLVLVASATKKETNHAIPGLDAAMKKHDEASYGLDSLHMRGEATVLPVVQNHGAQWFCKPRAQFWGWSLKVPNQSTDLWDSFSHVILSCAVVSSVTLGKHLVWFWSLWLEKASGSWLRHI